MGLRMVIIEGCDVTERHEEACEGRSDRLREAPRGQLPFQRKTAVSQKREFKITTCGTPNFISGRSNAKLEGTHLLRWR